MTRRRPSPSILTAPRKLVATVILLVTNGNAAAFVIPLPAGTTRSAPLSSTTKAHLQPVSATQLDIGVVSRVGADPNRPQKVNQDAYFHASFSQGDKPCYTCVGVLDGHGLKGHIVSEFLAQQLPLHFQKHVEDLSQEKLTLQESSSNMMGATITEVSLEEFEEKLQELSGLTPEEINYQEKQPLLHQAMTRAFHSVHWAAMQDKDIPSARNGATCVMVVVDHTDNKNGLHIAHVGDSRVVRLNRDQARPLSVETTIKMNAEKERIERGDGTVRGSNVFYGPVGIAMTRSLGNAVMLRAGVVPTPIVATFPSLQSDGECLVLATDGVWDVLRNDAVLELVAATRECKHDAQAWCDAIAAEARRKWVGDLPIVDEEKVDDITCLVVRPT